MAPEMLAGKQYGFKADIFSLGAVMFFLCFNDHAFSARMSSSIPHLCSVSFNTQLIFAKLLALDRVWKGMMNYVLLPCNSSSVIVGHSIL